MENLFPTFSKTDLRRISAIIMLTAVRIDKMEENKVPIAMLSYVNTGPHPQLSVPEFPILL